MISFTIDHNINVINDANNCSLYKFIKNAIHIPHGCKILLANLFPENYIVFRIHFTFDNKQTDCLVFENWRITNLPKAKYAHIEVNEELTKYSNFSEFEQEVIYCFLIGLKADKEIVKFIEDATKSVIKANIRYTITLLYNKFHCNTRVELYYALVAHGLDSKLPKTIFPSGQYVL